MEHIHLSSKKSFIFSLVLFVLGLVICIVLNSWWPSLALLIGIPFSFYQFLTGKYRLSGLSILAFSGVFITVRFEEIPWNLILPIVFSIAALYLFFSEVFFHPITVEEEEEDLNHEIEEHTDHEPK